MKRTFLLTLIFLLLLSLAGYFMLDRIHTEVFNTYYFDKDDSSLIKTTVDYSVKYPLVLSEEKIIGDVAYIVDNNKEYLLFVRENDKTEFDVWLLEKQTGNIKKLYKNASDAKISPDGSYFVVVSDQSSMYLLDRSGRSVSRIGIHGISPRFSSDGSYVAYVKLADKTDDLTMGSSNMFQGIAVYDIANDSNNVILNVNPGGNLGFLSAPFGIVEWSPVFNRIYFSSHENEFFPNTVAVWSIKPDGTGKRQETNKTTEEMSWSSFGQQVLWLENSMVAIGGAVHTFNFDEAGALIEINKIGNMDSQKSSLQWIEKNKIFIYLENKEEKRRWIKVDVQEINT